MPIATRRPARVPTSMRRAANLESQVVLANDLCGARERTLKAIDLAARQGGSLETLRNAIERELGDLRVREADLLRFDRQRHQRIAHTTYADEDPE